MFGKGVVARISHKGAKFPVVVNFDGLIERCYSLEGKYEQLYATQPTLFPYPIEIVKKVMKPSINWEHVHSVFKYLAQDEDGSAWLYSEKPESDVNGWDVTQGECSTVHSHASYTPGTCDWEDSLVIRPSVE